MGVGVAGGDDEALGGQVGGEGPGVGDHLVGVGGVRGGGRLAEGDGLGGDGVHLRTALREREDGPVDAFRQFAPAQDHAAAGSAQHLVRGGADDVGVRHRAGRRSPGDEPDGVRGVRDEVGAHLVGDVAEGGVVEVAGVGDGAADDRLGPAGAGQGAHLVVVDQPGLRVHAVADEVEPAAGEVRGRTVGEVSAVGQAEGEDGVAGAQEGGVGGQHGGGAGVGLHVGVLGAEEALGAFDGQPLGDVDDLAAAVVTGGRVTLGVLVGER